MTWVRSALFNVWFFGATLLYGLVGVGVRVWAPHRALGLAQGWSRTVLGGARVICGIRIAVTGRENLPDGAALIASQHQSAFDTLVWLMLLPRVSYVFKAELAQVPLFGSLLVPAGQIPLDRAAGLSAVRTLLRGAEHAAKAGRQIVIFPEGTRVAVGQAVPLRGGIAALALRTGLPITPVATDSGRYWGRRAFRKYPGTIHIAIGPPISSHGGQAVVLERLSRAWDEAAAGFETCG